MDKTFIASQLSLQEILKEALDAKKKLNQKVIWIHLRKHCVLVKVIMQVAIKESIITYFLTDLKIAENSIYEIILVDL